MARSSNGTRPCSCTATERSVSRSESAVRIAAAASISASKIDAHPSCVVADPCMRSLGAAIATVPRLRDACRIWAHSCLKHARLDSNQRPRAPEARALSPELRALDASSLEALGTGEAWLPELLAPAS